MKKKMQVHVTKGTLVSCDPAARERIVIMNEESVEKFILRDMDDNHLLVATKAVPNIQETIEEMYRRSNFAPNFEGMPFARRK